MHAEPVFAPAPDDDESRDPEGAPRRERRGRARLCRALLTTFSVVRLTLPPAALVLALPLVASSARVDLGPAVAHQVAELEEEIQGALDESPRPQVRPVGAPSPSGFTGSTLATRPLSEVRERTATWVVRELLGPTLHSAGLAGLARQAQAFPQVRTGDHARRLAVVFDVMVRDLETCDASRTPCANARRAIQAVRRVVAVLAEAPPDPPGAGALDLETKRTSSLLAHLVGEALKACLGAGLDTPQAAKAVTMLLDDPV